MESNNVNPQTWLHSEYKRRLERNPRYSLRMFAQQIGIPSGRLSELMSGKRRLTLAIARKISSQLLLSLEERKALSTSMSTKGAPLITDEFEPLTADTFNALADWQHFAILSLMETDGFQSNEEWVAERLGISLTVARESVQRLKRLNIIVERDGKWHRREINLTTTHDIENLALKISHRQSLEQVFTALDTVDIKDRDITSMTMSVDMKRLPKAKEMIKKFRRELCAFLESGDSKDEVYNINLQLVPVTVLKKDSK